MEDFVLMASEEVFPYLSSYKTGELFIEKSVYRSIFFTNGNIEDDSSGSNKGFCMDTFDDKIQFASSNDSSMNSVKKMLSNFNKSNVKWKHYDFLTRRGFFPENLEALDYENLKKNMFLINEKIRKNPLVQNVIISIHEKQQNVWILRKDGVLVHDKRPYNVISVRTFFKKNNSLDNVYCAKSSRIRINPNELTKMAQEVERKIQISLEAQKAPVGEMPIILGNAGAAIILHEAIGHGLEGDFNAKNLSAFSGKIGEKITSEEVTIYDDGTSGLNGAHINFDDEGTESQKTILIDKGHLVSYMQNNVSAIKMGVESTGNGRRESFLHESMPRMRNTCMSSGANNLEHIISDIKKGLYLVDFSNGQVEISSGQFSFASSEGYLIENGKIMYPVKDAVLSGFGNEVLENIVAVANDFVLSDHGGQCGKNGQWVPVGLGQPSFLASKMIVGSN